MNGSIYQSLITLHDILQLELLSADIRVTDDEKGNSSV